LQEYPTKYVGRHVRKAREQRQEWEKSSQKINRLWKRCTEKDHTKIPDHNACKLGGFLQSTPQIKILKIACTFKVNKENKSQI